METLPITYGILRKNGILAKRTTQARALLESCTLCPRKCRVNRLAGETGVCATGALCSVASYAPHFGEEPPLTGTHGSGTIFFSGCNLMCSFCQNYDISHSNTGREVTPDGLAAIMVHLQNLGCHNINLVTPTHVVPMILEALEPAVDMGLTIPLVYNSGGYDSVETLKLLRGIIDIYLPDFKFWDPEPADLTCSAPDYPETARNAVLEMDAQVGPLLCTRTGIARRGLLVRHLVLPNGQAGTDPIMKFLSSRLSPGTHVNIMSQYRPCGTARSLEGFSRPITTREFRDARQSALIHGLTLV